MQIDPKIPIAQPSWLEAVSQRQASFKQKDNTFSDCIYKHGERVQDMQGKHVISWLTHLLWLTHSLAVKCYNFWGKKLYFFSKKIRNAKMYIIADGRLNIPQSGKAYMQNCTILI